MELFFYSFNCIYHKPDNYKVRTHLDPIPTCCDADHLGVFRKLQAIL